MSRAVDRQELPCAYFVVLGFTNSQRSDWQPPNPEPPKASGLRNKQKSALLRSGVKSVGLGAVAVHPELIGDSAERALNVVAGFVHGGFSL